MRPLERIAAEERLRFREPINIVEKKLMEINVIPETDIRVYPDYPLGWHATVGANDRIYVIISRRGRISLSIESCYGFYKNGALRRRPVS